MSFRYSERCNKETVGMALLPGDSLAQGSGVLRT